VKSAHNQVVQTSFGFKGWEAHLGFVAGENLPFPPAPKLGGTTMLHRGVYIDALEHGTPLSIKAASIAVSTVLFLIVALPLLAVGAAVVA
jgi:hypothetical protein